MDGFIGDLLPNIVAALCYCALGIGAVVSAGDGDEKPSRRANKIKMQAGKNKAPKMPKLPKFTAEEYRIDTDAPAPTIRMTVEQWYHVPPNPFQKAGRDKRAGLAAKLGCFMRENATVTMGIYPDGSVCKINGHGRGRLYFEQPELVDRVPRYLTVVCLPVRDAEHAAQRFRIVDDKQSAKNASDDVHGAFRLRGIPTTSRFFQRANKLKSALQYAYEIVSDSTETSITRTPAKKASIDDFVDMFVDALVQLDAIDVKIDKLSAPFITAFLLAHTKHGDVIVPFFARINDGGYGRKTGKLMCPIAAIERERDRTQLGGKSQHMELVSKVLGALDTYMESARFSAENYLPQINMQKVMKVDLDQYLLRQKAKRTGRTKKNKQADEND